ncbi:hypothetical protein L1987_00403 [Smallanthus sonchifolius]|uniref:Uncharacterized protein n=1 Tax=Smallanthus sonchifolius TaxID=185202 RepID=A0ACB9K251_9ASTR|nr:hypothetical protein L1987_00403 [Smallanthus sonchifolius]
MATANRNPEIRKDAINNRLVILSPARSLRPSDFKSKSQAKSDSNPSSNAQPQCPFCAGNEHQCAPEIFRMPEDSTSNWKVRVIENLYPALSRDSKVKSDNEEYCHANGTAGEKRIEQLCAIDSINYVQVLKNHGASAGASMSHSHSQILAVLLFHPLLLLVSTT